MISREELEKQAPLGALVEIEWIDAFGWKNQPESSIAPEINNITRGRVWKYTENFIYIIMEIFSCHENHGDHTSGVAVPTVNIVKVSKK